MLTWKSKHGRESIHISLTLQTTHQPIAGTVYNLPGWEEIKAVAVETTLVNSRGEDILRYDVDLGADEITAQDMQDSPRMVQWLKRLAAAGWVSEPDELEMLHEALGRLKISEQ